jgi:hypothetical protein
MATVLFSGLGFFGTVVTSRKRKLRARKSIRWMSVLGLLLVVSLFAVGCGSNGSKASTTPPASTAQQVTLMVTGTSGSLTQSAAVTVTVN